MGSLLPLVSTEVGTLLDELGFMFEVPTVAAPRDVLMVESAFPRPEFGFVVTWAWLLGALVPGPELG